MFGPDSPAVDNQAPAKLSMITLAYLSLNNSIRFAELTAKVGSFDHNQLQLTWQYQGQTWLLSGKTKHRKIPAVFLPCGCGFG